MLMRWLGRGQTVSGWGLVTRKVNYLIIEAWKVQRLTEEG